MNIQKRERLILSIFTTALLVFSMTGIGYTHEIESGEEHFHDEAITLSVDENTPEDENIGEPLVVPDADESTVYELRGTYADWFSFDAESLQFKTLEALNYEDKDSYTVRLVVQRQEPEDDTSDTAVNDMDDTAADDMDDTIVTDLYSIYVTIKVNDVNEPPVFAESNRTIRSIDENTPANVKIGRPLRATDEDGDTLIYRLIAIDGIDNFVNINNKTGQLTTRTDTEHGGFDYETQSSYEMLVVAFDGIDRSEIKITINVNDVPEVEDTNLLTAIKEALGVVNGKLTHSHMLSLTKLDASNSEISSLEGLQTARNLRTLKLGKNNISSDQLVHLSNLRRLTSLYLGGNRISDISALQKLTNLQRLVLAKNDISDATGLSILTNLTILRLNHNEITDVEALSELTKLSELYLHDNAITDVEPLWNLSSLKVLTLENNPIEWTAHLYNLENKHNTDIDIEVSEPWDINNDGVVDTTDVGLVLRDAESTMSDEIQVKLRRVRSSTDVNFDGTVDNADVQLVLDKSDDAEVAGAPLLPDTALLKTLDPASLKMYLERLRTESDGSVKYREAIALLERMLSEVRPQKTTLLTNYPNPFNPETWIPYQLAKSSNVQVTIYDARGSVVRRLDLGHQQAGFYTSQSRAAYWDGRNTLGEQVGSGIYFYQLQADNVSPLRKMIILK